MRSACGYPLSTTGRCAIGQWMKGVESVFQLLSLCSDGRIFRQVVFRSRDDALPPPYPLHRTPAPRSCQTQCRNGAQISIKTYSRNAFDIVGQNSTSSCELFRQGSWVLHNRKRAAVVFQSLKRQCGRRCSILVNRIELQDCEIVLD